METTPDCPMCGEPASLPSQTKGGWWVLRCSNRECGASVCAKRRPDVISRWARREPERQLRDQIAQLESELRTVRLANDLVKGEVIRERRKLREALGVESGGTEGGR